MESIFLPSKMYFTPGEKPNEMLLTIEPLHHGYGTTIGNALRRVLLSSLPGAAVTAMKVKGAQHEFSALNGVKEDVLDIMLNLKKLRMKVHSEEPVVLKLSVKKEGEVTAADIEANADVEIVNPELVIATVTDKSASFDMEITVSRGRGFLPTEEREEAPTEIGVIAIDAMFSPVRTVGLKVENTRVGEITNYDKLLMTIATDGSITPQEAVEQATKILLNHFTWVQGQLQHASLTEQIVRASEEGSDNK
ncbi:MAG TPA: DNA-directed RNA polymerase subunit alpha [bacterium]|nr:DNA-directed polymerase subunit alpha [Patescibacteria group bacterium]HRH31957.1 DNA-directed RNA polymerase subunit alpha [bacterium]